MFQAFRQDRRTLLPHSNPAVPRNSRFRHCDLDDEAVSSLFCSVRSAFSAYYPSDTYAKKFSFLMAQSYAGFICFLTWTSNTFARPASKRAVALAFVNAFSQLGNIVGSCVFFSYLLCRLQSAQIRMAKIVGSNLQSLLRDLHCDQRALYCNVLHL